VQKIRKNKMMVNKDNLMTAQRFTIEILSAVFYRGYGEYYFKRRFIELEKYREAGKSNIVERIEKDIIDWNNCWYVKRNPEEYGEAKNAAIEIITQVGDELSWFLRKINYTEDVNDPQMEVWRFGYPIVPYWRLMFEYKRMLIDKRLEEEKNSPVKTITEVTTKVEEKSITKVDKSKPPAINFEMKGKGVKKDIKVIIDPVKEEIIPPPNLIKNEEGYKVESQNETYTNIYLKVDPDDPVIEIPKIFINVQKKQSKEEILEEQCCHGEAMRNSPEEKNVEMLGGDLSLKTYLSDSKNISEEAVVKRSSYIEAKDKIETFFKTNIEEITENKSKLAKAKENCRFKKQEYCVNKELSFEMDPFRWDLVK
jgi:hypothetical protein